MNKLTYILLISTALFSSCKIGQKYEQPEMNIPQAFDAKITNEGNASDIGWSALYKDSVLQGLITKALDHNKDMLTVHL